MKTIKIYQSLLVIAIFALSIVSCKKVSDSTSTSTTPQVKEMVIVDNGLENSAFGRSMLVTLPSQDYAITNPNGVVKGQGAIITLRFFVDKDGLIPSGTYNYATTSNKLPFTFTEGTVQLYNKSTLSQQFVMSYGTVIVQTNGSDYNIEFSAVLSDVSTFNANYKGGVKLYVDSF
jgi:hypothetical protein